MEHGSLLTLLAICLCIYLFLFMTGPYYITLTELKHSADQTGLDLSVKFLLLLPWLWFIGMYHHIQLQLSINL